MTTKNNQTDVSAIEDKVIFSVFPRGVQYKPGITFLISISFFPQSDPDYNAAGKALYASKSNGKHQITVESV